MAKQFTLQTDYPSVPAGTVMTEGDDGNYWDETQTLWMSPAHVASQAAVDVTETVITQKEYVSAILENVSVDIIKITPKPEPHIDPLIEIL